MFCSYAGTPTVLLASQEAKKALAAASSVAYFGTVDIDNTAYIYRNS